ncbi:hypothetical protein CEXT_494861 [Caerostris extrusa]|uniref:EGF-like domain-containing protein n=1 Tax=Caerostris extrusa TaxID=172846 RepID=A0AAV4XE68_CAEEX|nr:hypothetical protein CEXT_494861 [Caerostris extrusa]
MTSTTKFLTTPSCECGRYARSCRFDYFGRQVCECYPGYVQINNYCHEESTTAISFLASVENNDSLTDSQKLQYPKLSMKSESILRVKIISQIFISSATSTPSVVTSEKPRTTIPTTTPKGCYCGINSRSCRLNWFGRKVCDCYPGYEQIDGYCLGNVFIFSKLLL